MNFLGAIILLILGSSSHVTAIPAASSEGGLTEAPSATPVVVQRQVCTWHFCDEPDTDVLPLVS